MKNVTIFDGVRWLQGNLSRLSDESCEIESHATETGQPFGANAILTINAVDSADRNTINARACLVKAYYRDGVWRFVCRIAPAQSRALASVMAA